MKIHVFLLCYNESAILPHTIKHYRTHLPSCKIIIYDNKSTDNSVEIAKELGCRVISWNSGDILNERKQTAIKNNCWKEINNGWIIVADMDEFLCITEEELLHEKKKGTSILKVKGIDMIGESESFDLTDIDLQIINKYEENVSESKNLCFFRKKIKEMHYDLGAHTCYPQGQIKYSSKEYYNKHMSYLGLKFITNKILKRYERTRKMRKKGLAIHYTDEIQKITDSYYSKLINCKIFSSSTM